MAKIVEHPALKEMTKVTVSLGDNAWHGYSRETLWAKAVPAGGYELRNTPFFASGFALGDVVSVRQDDERALLVDGVLRRSGHSTYRVFVDAQNDRNAKPMLAELSELGCSYESLKGPAWTLYAFDMPRGIARTAYLVLERGLRAGIWDFDEGLFMQDDASSGLNQ